MLIIDVIDEDMVNYKKPCMTVLFPYCTFKCNKECGKQVCHNLYLENSSLIDMPVDEIVDRYINNPISEAIVMQGLEPFDSYNELYSLICAFSKKCSDDIVIYTGYREDEIISKLSKILSLDISNTIIVKFGRFIPNSESVIDPVLGVKLNSKNQYAKVIKNRG